MDLEGLLGSTSEGEDTRVVTGFQVLAPEARRAFKAEILPQLGDIHDLATLNDYVVEVTQALSDACKKKDQLYTRLVRYKAIDQTDDSFFQDITDALNQWAERKAKEGLIRQAGLDRIDDLERRMRRLESALQVGPSVGSLKQAMADALEPGAHENVWALTEALTSLLKAHSVRGVKVATDGSQHVTVDFGGHADAMTLEYHAALGWRDRSGLRSPQQSAVEMLARVARVA